MTRLLLLPALLATVLAGQYALVHQAQAQAIDMSGGGPVEVTSRGGFELRENDKVVIATGDARAVRDNVTVLADRLIARYRKKPGHEATTTTPVAPDSTNEENGGNEVYRLEAHGHVRILTATDEAIGDDAVYDIDQAVLLMTGSALKLTTPQQVLTARDSMEYWSQQHMAVGRGNAVVVTTDGRRISADTLVAYTTEGTPAAPTTVSTGPAKTPAKHGDPMADSGKLKRVDAFGNVEVRTAVDIVRGDRGMYLPETGIARVVGHVRITHGGSQVNGPAADVNMKTGVARITASPGGRVEGLLVPNDAKNTAEPQKPSIPGVPTVKPPTE